MATDQEIPFRGWIASLSNGETVFETEESIEGMSAWQYLRKRCADEGLYVTQIRLHTWRSNFHRHFRFRWLLSILGLYQRFIQ